jgi:hypothetical protein
MNLGTPIGYSLSILEVLLEFTILHEVGLSMKEGPVFCITVFAIAKGLIVAVYSYLSHIGMSVKGPYQRRKPQLKDLSSW